jgi:hypothetical protein
MQSLAPAKMNQFEMVTLCEMLQDHADHRRARQAAKDKLPSRIDTQGRKVPVMEISQPPRSMLSYFVRCEHGRIMERMEISDEEEYFDLVV